MSAPNGNNLPPNYPSSAYSHLLNQAPHQAPQQPAPPGPQQAPGQQNAAPRMLQPQPQPQPMQPQPMQPQPAGYQNMPNAPAPFPVGVEAGGPPELRGDRKRDREEGEGEVNDRAKRARVEPGAAGPVAAGAAPAPVPAYMPDENDPDTMCRAAIRSGNADAFLQIWQSGTLEGGADNFFATAVGAGQVEIARFLLEAGADPNGDADDDGDPPIVVAAQNNDLAMAQLLLEQGADINAWHVDGSEMGALAASLRHPDLALFKFLLAQGANTGAVTWRRRVGDAEREEIEDGSGMPYTPLMMAAGSGNIEAIQLLLDKGVDLTTQDQDFCDAFRHAAKSGQLAVCQLLVQHGAEVDAESWGDCARIVTSLTCAAEGGNLAILQMVVDARRQAQAKLAEPGELVAAIEIAVKAGKVNSVLTLCSQQFELELIAQPFAMKKAKEWMVTAIRAGDIAMMEALHTILQSQFTGWQLDGHAMCLEAMAAQKHDAVAWLVHNFRIDINAPGSLHGPGSVQVTLLMQAATTGDLPMMQRLLQLGAKIVVDRTNGQVVQRYSALDSAVQSGQNAAFSLLQEQVRMRGNG